MSAAATQPADAVPRSSQRSLPPVAEVAVATLALIVVGGIYQAAHMPHHVPLGVPIALLALAGGALAFNALTVARLRDFAWRPFKQVGGWALLAYAVIAGMLEYVFVNDGAHGSALVVLTLMLLVFALDVPLLLAFSVAQYQQPGDGA